MYVELCFHEDDALLADLASRGLTETGGRVLRRPVRDGVAPAPSAAAKARILLYTKSMHTLGAFHPALAEARRGAVVIPVDAPWPARQSRPWLFAAPPLEAAPLQVSAYWRMVRTTAEALTQAPRRRLSLQRDLHRQLRRMRPSAQKKPLPVAAPETRRAHKPVRSAFSYHKWEGALAPLAVVMLIVFFAAASMAAIEVAAKPEAYGRVSHPAAADNLAFSAEAPKVREPPSP